MANSITSSAAFATANMKPLPDEQIDALWGQNIADNTGFLYGREQPHYYENFYATCQNIDSAGITKVLATTIYDKGFFRVKGHNTFVGTGSLAAYHYGLSAVETYDNLGTIIWGIYGDLGTFEHKTEYSQANTARYSFLTNFATTFSLAAYVSEGSWAKLRVTNSGVTTDPNPGAFGQMVWGVVDLKILSKWA